MNYPKTPTNSSDEAIKEVGAEFPLLDHLSEIAMRGADHAHIGVYRGSAAQALELSFLHDPKNLGL